MKLPKHRRDQAALNSRLLLPAPMESCGRAALRLAKNRANRHWRGRFPAIEAILRRMARSGDSMAASRSSDWRISSRRTVFPVSQ